ncbi:MAG: hypothetical protein U0325_13635 [Polyangiales bacterium]
MVRHLALADGFVLALVYVADDQRPAWDDEARALPAALASARGAPVEVVHLRAGSLARDPCSGAESQELLSGLLDALDAQRPAWSLVILDATRCTGVEDDACLELFERLNERRNALRAQHRGGLCLALHARLEGLLARNAPDLWSIRGPVMRLGAPDGDLTLDAPHEPVFTATDPARIAECRAAESSPERRARWTVRAALCALSLQRNDLARMHLAELDADAAARHPDLRAWRALLRGDLDPRDAAARAEVWADAAMALPDAHWALRAALHLRVCDALLAPSPDRALAHLDAAASLVPPDLDEAPRATFDFEVVTRRVDLLAPRDPRAAAALALALVEELRLAHRHTRTHAPLRLLALALLRLGDLDARLGQRDAAAQAWRDALAVVRDLRARDPGRSAWARGESLLQSRLATVARDETDGQRQRITRG